MAEESNIHNNPNQAMLGLNTDNISQQIKPGTLTYSLNAQIDNFDGNMVTYQNEQSNVLCSEFKTGYKIIGHHSFLSRTILFMTNPATGDSEIGELTNVITCNVDDPSHLNEKKSSNYVNNGYNNLDSSCNCSNSEPILTFYELYKKFNPDNNLQVNSCCQYRTLVDAKCLGFSINYPIHNIVHRIVDINDDANKCGTEIYWADGLNPRRYLNLDSLPYETIVDGCDRIQSNVIDCNLLEVSPVIKVPCITPLVVSDGGSLIGGSYQFGIQYANDKAEGYTAYYSITNSIGIFKDRYGFDYNFQTDKSIKLLISNLDLNFKYFNLVVIETVNGVTTPKLVGTYEILSTSTEIVYSGNNQTEINLTIQDIFQKFPYYSSASEVAVVNDSIMWANLKSDKRISYQKIANAITLQWGTYQITYDQFQSYKNGVNSALYRGYMRDEVYAFEIVFILKNGQQTDGFHIPGRTPISSDLELIDNDDVITSELGNCVVEPDEQPRWKVYNTGSYIGDDPLYTAAPDKDCYIGPYQYGNMSYWESDRDYPCNADIWGDLAGTKIRHHKFPDSIITHIHDSNTADDRSFTHKIFPIGVKINKENIRQAIVNSDLTDTQKRNIIGYRIVRSDRVNNKSVIAKGLLYNMGLYTPYSEGEPETNQEVFYPNYPFNDLGDDPFLTNLSSVNDGGFSSSFLTQMTNDVALGQQILNTMESYIPTITAQCYTDTNICANDFLGTRIIEITNSQIADVQNKIFLAKQTGKDLITAIQSLIDYYNNKVQNNEQICQDDVENLTLNPDFITDYLTSLTDIETSGGISNFQDIVDYINTNGGTLNTHSYVTEIFNLRSNLVNFLQNITDIDNVQEELQNDYDSYELALDELALVECDGSVINESSFSSSRFTFHSPDTHFFQPFLGTILKFETLEGGTSIGNFVQVQNHAGHKLISKFSGGIALTAGVAVGTLFILEPRQYNVWPTLASPGFSFYAPAMPSAGTIAEKALYWNQQFKTLIDNLLQYKNYAYQYNAIGLYDKSEEIPNAGFKQRGVDKAYYLLPGQQAIGDIATINNWNRESSVFFRTNQTSSFPLLPNDPAIIGSLAEDGSRVGYSSLKQIYSSVLSYYASNKRKMLDQYGDMYSYGTVDTGYCGLVDINTNYFSQTDIIFGGDIFINRFGLKRKLSYFIDTAVGKPDGIDIDYSSLSNVGKTKYWYNTSSQAAPGSGFGGLIESLLEVPQSNLDGNTNRLFYQNGRIYLYSYGVAYFFVESEVNVDFRQAGNNTTHDYYPNVGTGIPNDWLQEKNVPIVHDNYYIYNKTYSKQNKENYFSHLPLSFDPTQECLQDYSHRTIYSDPSRWRIYKPNSYFDFPRNHGPLTSIDTINNGQILVRFENKSFIYNALTSIQTSTGRPAYLGNADVFRSAPPLDFGETDLGYAGSQHRLLLKTEAGHLFIDAKRGSIFLINGSNIAPISDIGMSKWFNRNLSFNIKEYFSDVNIDNTFNGVGLTGVWDNKNERFLISKLDYSPVEEFKNDITYDKYYGKFYYKGTEILLEDPKYFCNKSWTLSYSPLTKSWVSFHSYVPNFYIGLNGYFLTGKNGYFNNQKASTWVHNLTHTSYQNFYGKLEPYIIEYPFVFKAQDEILQNIKDYTTILEYYNENDYYELNDGVYFNKAVLWNNQQCSGVLNLLPKPKGKMNLYFNYPKYNIGSKDILYTKSDNFFNYNTFWDVVKNPNNHYPIWIDSCINKSIDKVLNNDKLDYSKRSHQKTKLRAKELRVRHINDIFDRYKFISKFILASTQVSYK